MYLKSLTLKGFKSFADRAHMTFEPGLTVIVGPNGSGKSNISDSILWVLGEQSAKQLRGQAMEDVIFSGSSARKPVGVAEVTLVLDNSDHMLPVDFDEVAITRRMYRSGESEYLINSSPCRLMDIQDILHDSGLGKDTHSIISQGKLDAILQSRPEERRALIEEAAGISKHKRRKERALKKIKSMDEHLTRARDINKEIARQLRPLERQVDRARKYKELSSRANELTQMLAVDELRSLQSQWNDLESRSKEGAAELELAQYRLGEKERELEKIMYGFINGEIDVLVSTTIIETGLDISNVNTMIIHDSDQMGLSQLYQLRGRVGRSNRTSYAFLMYRRNKMLKEVAEKRLHAIREFTEMGSGFKIAMRDLEIRGAGNLLGAEQSGHMESVGYDLYCKMLAEAVQEAKGIAPAEAFETTIDLNVSAYIPDSYISNESLKLDTYKRIAAIENKEEYEDMTEELTDRFGEPPKNVQNLLAVAELKALAHCAYVTELKQMGDSVRVTLQQHAKIDVARIPELLQKYRDELKFQMESLAFVYTPRRRNSKEKIDLLEKSHALVEDLLQITQE